MKIRKVSPLLLLLAPSLVRSASDVPSRDPDIRRRDAQAEVLPARRETEPPVAATRTTVARAAQPSKPYKGTEDAPVDGLDGKPHAGPFVDMTPEEVGRLKDPAKPTSLDRFATSGDERWKVEDIPERHDGVMNDENRVAPKKGTTGTEGGISEKEKLRKETGYGENKPLEPKEAPLNDELRRKSNEYSGGLARPENLPERPRDIRYPPVQHSSRVGKEPPQRTSWLVDTMPYTEGKTNPKPTTPNTRPHSTDAESWHEWFHSFVLSLTMILFSEIGDKTFLVAALMAMRHNQILVFSAAFGALIVMTILSAVLGHAVPTLLPKRLTTFAAALLFLVFGTKMLREGLAMPADMGVGEEMKEVEAELEEKEHSIAVNLDRSRRRSSLSAFALESGRGRQMHKLPGSGGEPSPPASHSPSPSPSAGRVSGLMNLCSLMLSPAWVQTFVMTFLGEWGDRSQIATIAMAAGQDYWWVTLGAITGHACCTGLAVIGGRALAGRVSMRVVTIGGALAFLVFGVIYLLECIFE